MAPGRCHENKEPLPDSQRAACQLFDEMASTVAGRGGMDDAQSQPIPIFSSSGIAHDLPSLILRFHLMVHFCDKMVYNTICITLHI
jgi:hypothetical protein